MAIWTIFGQILLSIFAILGIWDSLRLLLNAISAKRNKLSLEVYIGHAANDSELEYTIRFVEDYLSNDDISHLFRGIVVGPEVAVSNQTLCALQKEYQNVEKL